MREVRCTSCGTLNRVVPYAINRVPSCGKCHTELPESPTTKLRRATYKIRYFVGAGIFILGTITLASIWQPISESISSQAKIGDSCSSRPQPRQGIYAIYGDQSARPAALTVRTAPGSGYFVKLEDAVTATPVMSFFINGGSTLDETVPLGRFILKFATGKYWCGHHDLFGPDTITNKADDIFVFERRYTSDGYNVNHWIVELIRQRHGNLRTRRIAREEF